MLNMPTYPLGLNLFFQPGFGPGFFLTLGSSGAFGLRLLLLGTVTLRALGREETGTLHTVSPSLLFNPNPLLKNTCTHLLSEYGSNNSSSDNPLFLLSSKSSSEITLDKHTHTHTVTVLVDVVAFYQSNGQDAHKSYRY